MPACIARRLRSACRSCRFSAAKRKWGLRKPCCSQEELMQREDHLEAAFHRLDADSNGTISIDELTRVLPTRSRHEVQQALTKFDTNGDGMLDLAEFKYALRSLHSNLGADEDIAVAEDNTAPLNTFGGVGSTSIRPAPATTTRRIHGTHIQISIV
eukprot:m.1461882 g.1461882  ORF g.1461882 m.1461882 type:complete len:156 (+) comp25133_c2_seq7:1743-2210(+)